MADSKALTVEKLMAALDGKYLAVNQQSPSRVSIDVGRRDAREAVLRLLALPGARLITVTGVDTPPGIELLYHVTFQGTGLVCTVQTLLPKPQPSIESLATELPAAEWIEREVHELLGVEFRGHPDPRHLVLADDWPDAVHPLRKALGSAQAREGAA